MQNLAAEIHKARITVASIVRVCGALLVILVLQYWIMYLAAFVRASGVRALLPGHYTVQELLVTFLEPSYLLLLVTGLLMLTNGVRIARWFTPFPNSANCPKCRFSLESFRADRCPECGLYLGPDFHAPPAPTESVQSETPASQ